MSLLPLLGGGCAAESTDEPAQSGEDALAARADDEWFYAGPLPALGDAKVTVSLAGHTAHVTGYLPAGTQLPALPHVKTMPEGGRLRVDVVYPIATAMAGKSNSSPGTYSFYRATPYRPNGLAFTAEEGQHQVPWGGFPFLAYNGGIAFHGPITSEVGNGAGNDVTVWYLRRGQVSHGCNRMQGENVVELAHVLGIDMRKLYTANRSYAPPRRTQVTVIADFDQYDGKYIDVDYAIDTGVTRPGKLHGPENVAMFGSWVASMTPDGRDLPPDMKWEGGVAGKPYVFAEHVMPGMVCSFAKEDLPALKALVAKNGELPASVCAKKDCIVTASRAHGDVKAACGL